MKKYFASFLIFFSLTFSPATLLAESVLGVGTSSPTGDLNIPDVGLPDPGDGIKGILTTFLKWLLGIFGMVALASFVISGFQYFLAKGDDKAMETAKKNLTYSVIGVIVGLSGVIVIQAIDSALRAKSF